MGFSINVKRVKEATKKHCEIILKLFYVSFCHVSFIACKFRVWQDDKNGERKCKFVCRLIHRSDN
jgi:hypothetical protein